MLILWGNLLFFAGTMTVGLWWLMLPDPSPQLLSYSWLLLPLWGLLMAYLVFSYRCIGYVVREQDIGLYSGVVFRRLVVQPYTRLQHVEISRGPLERLWGLATIKLFSAGGALHSLAVPGLDLGTAEALREYILRSRGLAIEQ